MGVFGVFRRDGAPVGADVVHSLGSRLSRWAQPGEAYVAGPIGLGAGSAGQDFVFSAVGRIDNRAEVAAACGAPPGCDDAGLMAHAYRRWGQDCCPRLLGDWCFAAWHPGERRLFLARDQFGFSSVYYAADARQFVFAPAVRPLLDLGLAGRGIDELYVAQVVAVLTSYHGERTAHQHVRRLPPAHCLTVTADRLEVRCYWRMEDHIPAPPRDPADYAPGLRDRLDQAVRDRLVPGAGGRPGIAVTLSGGLDSGSVTASAAAALWPSGRRLQAYTSIPVGDPAPFHSDKRFGDEFQLAEATARHAGGVDLHPISAAHVTPLQAIRQTVGGRATPSHAAANLFWMQEVFRRAAADGAGALLLGQFGNAGLSWPGDWSSRPLAGQIRDLGLRSWLLAQPLPFVPAGLGAQWRHWRTPEQSVVDRTGLRLDVVRRLKLRERAWAENRPSGSALERRLRWLKPGQNNTGGFLAETGAAAGIEVRDPTADIRLLTYALSIPDAAHRDPASGMDRWVVREAMRGRLPDDVRLNPRRGLQAADVVLRLRASAAEVEAALDEVARGPAAEYFDAGPLRRGWALVQNENTPGAFRDAGSLVLRALMAGLFVNEFHG